MGSTTTSRVLFEKIYIVEFLFCKRSIKESEKLQKISMKFIIKKKESIFVFLICMRSSSQIFVNFHITLQNKLKRVCLSTVVLSFGIKLSSFLSVFSPLFLQKGSSSYPKVGCFLKIFKVGY